MFTGLKWVFDKDLKAFELQFKLVFFRSLVDMYKTPVPYRFVALLQRFNLTVRPSHLLLSVTILITF